MYAPQRRELRRNVYGLAIISEHMSATGSGEIKNRGAKRGGDSDFFLSKLEIAPPAEGFSGSNLFR